MELGYPKLVVELLICLGKAAEVVEEFSMSKCCVDTNGLTHVNSTDTVLDPATCSYRKCQGKVTFLGYIATYSTTTVIYFPDI